MDNEITSEAGREGSKRPTYGELRRQLDANGNPWTVDPLFSDEEPLPDFPMGGLPENMGERSEVPVLDPDVDIRELIAELPPNDEGLRRRWAEADVPLDRVPAAVTGDRVEDIQPPRTANTTSVDREAPPKNDGLGSAS
jgi:hypothetical protein